MTERYEFWIHMRWGKTWAVRLDERGLVAGCCGPLDRRELRRARLPQLVYDPDPAEWFDRHAGEFLVRDDVE